MRLFGSSSPPLMEIVGDLGCCTETLRAWIAQSEVDGGKAEGLPVVAIDATVGRPQSEDREGMAELHQRVRQDQACSVVTLRQ